MNKAFYYMNIFKTDEIEMMSSPLGSNTES